MRVLVTPDYRTLSQTATELVIKALRAKSYLSLSLPTGRTPLGMYEELVRQHREKHLDFSELRTFNLNEYLKLPQDHPKAYHIYIRRHFFEHVNMSPENIHIPDRSPEIDADRENKRYEEAIH